MPFSIDNGARADALKDYFDAFPGNRHDTAHAEDFQAILNDYRESGQEAKAFIQTLEPEKLQALQKYQRLADTIQTGALSQEGAENLLRSAWEKVDIDGDGAYTTGNGGKILPDFPPDAPVEYIETMTDAIEDARAGGMSDSEIFQSVALMQFRFISINIDTGETTFKSKPSDFTREGLSAYLDTVNENHAQYGTGPESDAANAAINLFFDYFYAAQENRRNSQEAHAAHQRDTQSHAARQSFLARAQPADTEQRDHADGMKSALASVQTH